MTSYGKRNNTRSHLMMSSERSPLASLSMTYSNFFQKRFFPSTSIEGLLKELLKNFENG